MSTQDRRVCCVRCGQPSSSAAADADADDHRLSAPHFGHAARGAGAGDVQDPHDAACSVSDALPDFVELEDWDFEETIRHAQQLVNRVTSGGSVGGGSESEPSDAVAERAQVAGSSAAVSSDSGGSTLPWLILALGIGVFTCGAALMGLSLARDSGSLWQLALPMVLGGQLAVLFVVIWQLEVVWHSNRATYVALHTVDDKLRRFHIHAGHVQVKAPATDRFIHPVPADVSPQLQLDDLRAQLDALAMRLDHTKDAA